MTQVAIIREESFGAAVTRRIVVQQADAGAGEETELVIARLVQRAGPLADVPWPERNDVSRQLGAQQLVMGGDIREFSASLQGSGASRMKLVADQIESKASRFIEYLQAGEASRPRLEGER